MGHLINTSNDKGYSINKVLLNSSSNRTIKGKKAKLYKPIEEFSWKDATKREVKEEAIASYKQFAF